MIKIIAILLIILYILFILYIIYNKNYNKENFTGYLDILAFTSNKNNIIEKKDKKYDIENKINKNEVKKDEVKKDEVKKDDVKEDNVKNKKIKKYIFILNKNNSKYIKNYNFYNKNYRLYLKSTVYDNNYDNILIKDLSNNIIGKDINKIYNKIIINLELYKENIVIEYYNKYQSIKIYLKNNDNIFNIDKKNDNYIILLYKNIIGSILYNKDSNIYKIIVYEDYKIYLNMFGIGLILLLNY